MAKLSTPSLLLLLFLYTTLITPSSSHLAPDTATDNAAAPAPSISAADDSLVEHCMSKFTKRCGPQLFGGVFLNFTVTAPCCKNLVVVGKPCHDRLVQRIIDYYTDKVPVDKRKIREKYVAKLLARSERIWSECVKVGWSFGGTQRS